MSALTQPNPQPERQPRPQPVTPPPSQPEKSRSRWVGKLVIVLLLGGAIAWYVLQPQATSLQTPVAPASQIATVVRGKIVKSIRAAGQTAATDFANISAPEVRARGLDRSLTIIKLAAGGSMVKKGDVIAEFDTTVLQDKLDDQRALVEVAEANLAKKKAELAVQWETFQQTLRVAKAN